MLLWLEQTNDLLGRYPYLISAIAALGTYAAVVVSLMIALWAQRANKTKLVARIYVVDIILEGVAVKKPPQYITVSITNTGTMPLRIPLLFLSWRLPFQWRTTFAVSPLDFFKGYPYIPQRSYPVEIPPRANECFHVGTPDLQKKEAIEIWKKYWWRLYIFRWFVRFRVATEDGYGFKVIMSKEVRRIMAEKPVKS